MGRKNHSLIYQAQKILEEKLRIGISKHKMKISGEDFTRYIFSWSTYNSYMKHIGYFAAWVKEHQYELVGRKLRTIEECKPFVDRFIQYNIDRGLSSYTIKLQVSALVKLYSCRSTDFIKTPSRRRVNIKRSRYSVGMDKHFNPDNHPDLVTFAKCTGLRRRELAAITGSALFQDENGVYKLRVDKCTKGGKMRETVIFCENKSELDTIIRLCKESDNSRIFKKIPIAMDVHYYRGLYAKFYYKSIARPINHIKNERLIVYKNRVLASYTTKNGRRSISIYNKICKELNLSPSAKGLRDVNSVYYCRNDLKNVAYDRRAMFEVSLSLGHNREGIIAEHYLY